MSFETEGFDAIYDALILARCQLRIGRKVIAKAICAGIGINRQSTNEGQFGGIEANVRLLASDEPGGEIKNGTVIEILQEGKTEWINARVGGRFTVGGLTRLVLEAVNE
jgi:hypothetical protein